MEIYEDMQDLISDDPTPPITPSVGDSEDVAEDLDEGLEEDFSDGTETVETPSSSDDTWKHGALYGDTSSVNTEDSLEASTSSRRREARSEGGKRVTFAEEEFLVRVVFIPVDSGPSLEELAPCDPDTLVEDISEMTIEGYSPVSPIRAGPSGQAGRKPTPSSPCRLLDGPGGGLPVSRFGRGLLGCGVMGPGVGKFGTPTMKALGRGLCLQGRPSPTAPKPAPRERLSTSGFSNDRSPEVLEETPPDDKKQSGDVPERSRSTSEQSTTGKNSPKCDNDGTGNDQQLAVNSPRRHIKSANPVGRRRLLPPTPEERLEPLFRHANRKIRSAAWSGKQTEPLQSSAHLLHGHLQARRLQGITSRSTSALHRVTSMDDLKPTNLNRSRSMSYDSVKTSTAGTSSSVSPSSRLTAGTKLTSRNFQNGRRALTRRSLPVRPDQTSGTSIDERLTLLNASSPLPRVHQSPYRQSSLPPLGQRSVTFLEAGCNAAGARERSGSARSDAAATSGQVHAMKHVNTPLATRKLYAWHMANGTLGANAHLETPCIAPLWDVLPKTSDSPVPATSLS